jgi:hypothetical protein
MRRTNSAIQKAGFYLSASLEATQKALKALENAVEGAFWRLLCRYSSPLSEHEARQILRATQKKRGKGRKFTVPGGSTGSKQPPRSPHAP